MDDKPTRTSGSRPYELPSSGFVRLSDFVGKGKMIPVSRSTWYSWIRTGKAIKPTQLGPRVAVYPVQAVADFISEYTAD